MLFWRYYDKSLSVAVQPVKDAYYQAQEVLAGGSIEEARDNLRESIELFFETASVEEVKQRFHDEIFVTRLEVAVG